jgi:HPr kinase/phosphorylase
MKAGQLLEEGRLVEAGQENRHGVAIAVGDIGLLILGESGAGKSSLAASLLSDRRFGTVRLVADDRVLLARHGNRIVARPHPAIAGALELRGYGIVHPSDLDAVVLRGMIQLTDARLDRFPEVIDRQSTLLGLSLPCLILPADASAITRMITIWPYFRGQICNDRSILDHRP